MNIDVKQGEKIVNSVNGDTKKEGFFSYVVKNVWLYIMLVPILLYLLIFKYIPMFGIVIAFKDFNFVKGILGSDWVGLKYFKELFVNSPDFWNAFKNSLILNFYDIIWGFPAPIILALLLNELKHMIYKRTLQTVFYLPHFISWVVIAGIIINFLSPPSGIFNYIIHMFGGEPIAFLQKPEYFRTIIVVSDIWKEAGWGTIIYLAAITSIDPQTYEAALIDGANRFQRVRYVTLPGIMSTIIILLIMRMGSLLSNGFEKIFLLYNPLTYSTSDVLETFTYRVGLQSGLYSYAAAAGLFSSIIGFVMIMLSNWMSRTFSGRSIW